MPPTDLKTLETGLSGRTRPDFGSVRPRVQIPGPRPKLDRSDPNIWAIEPGPTPGIAAQSIGKRIGATGFELSCCPDPIDNDSAKNEASADGPVSHRPTSRGWS